jgi:pyruvate dehydrogenase E2 component (dihydrolipoyllysine-residue acetyltransferase)
VSDGIKGEVRLLEPDRAERAIARRSAEARATIPDLELSVEAEVKAGTGTAELVRACALALGQVARANGAYRDGRFELYSRINVGLVVASEERHVIPTVFDAERKSLHELAQEISRLTERAAAGELSAPELGGATFTLSNPGALGVAGSTPLVVSPQAAAVAAGAVRAVAVVRDGTLVAGHAMTLTLACDHRILYGVHAARFLTAIKAALQSN